jgi:quercetin dioxygenase-like cupin family protein
MPLPLLVKQRPAADTGFIRGAPDTNHLTTALENVMNVIEQTRPAATPIPGVAHATWAGQDHGLQQLSVWRQTLAPGAATPPHRHDCDEVVLCLAGWGEVHTEGAVQRFGADCTLVLPKGRDHQIFNVGPQPMEIVGVFGATPVLTRLPDGSEIDLPWRS